MTVKEFEKKYQQIKENAVSHHGSTTYDYWEDENGDSAAHYDDGFCRELTLNNVTYILQEIQKQKKSKIIIKRIQ